MYWMINAFHIFRSNFVFNTIRVLILRENILTYVYIILQCNILLGHIYIVNISRIFSKGPYLVVGVVSTSLFAPLNSCANHCNNHVAQW